MIKDEGLILTKKVNKEFMDRHFKRFEYTYAGSSFFSGNLIPVIKNEKYGYIDNKGNLVIPCIFDFAYEFKENKAIVKIKNKYGYIDNLGNLIIEPIYDMAYDFNDNKALVKKNGLSFYIEFKGLNIKEKENNITLIKTKNENKYGIVDNLFNELIPNVFNELYLLNNDIGLIIGNIGGYNYIFKISDFKKFYKEKISICKYNNLNTEKLKEFALKCISAEKVESYYDLYCDDFYTFKTEEERNEFELKKLKVLSNKKC